MGSFLDEDLGVANSKALRKAEASGGLISELSSSQGRQLSFVTFNSKTNDFAVADSHGQVFYFSMATNKYQLIRLAGSSPVSSMCFLHTKLHYLAVAYEAGDIIIIDTIARKSVSQFKSARGQPVRMLRCHPTRSLLIGYSENMSSKSVVDQKEMEKENSNKKNSYAQQPQAFSASGKFAKVSLYKNVPVQERFIDIYDLKTQSVARSLQIKETCVDFQFMTGSASTDSMTDKDRDRDRDRDNVSGVGVGADTGKYLSVLLARSGLVVYRTKDLSLALTCPFPSSTERMPSWTSFAQLTCSPVPTDEDRMSGRNGGGGMGYYEDITEENLKDEFEEEKPEVRFVTAGSNGKLYMWESPSAEEMQTAQGGATVRESASDHPGSEFRGFTVRPLRVAYVDDVDYVDYVDYVD